MKRRSTAFVLALAALTLVACGDGGGVTGTGYVIGSISGLGSIVVDGIEIDVSRAVVTVDGKRAFASELVQGMVVEVRGDIDVQSDTGIAARVTSDPEVRGPVDDADAANATFVVLGQTVLAGPDTVFEGTTLEQISLDDVLETSGFIDADGNLRATRIAAVDGDYALEARGFVADLDETAETFRVGDQLVDYGDADVKGELRDGAFVEVESSHDRSGGLLLAERVRVVSGAYPDGVEEAVAEGVVSEVRSADEFVLNRVRTVRVTEQTVYASGTAGDVVANAHVVVEGTVEDDVLVAARVDLAPGDQ